MDDIEREFQECPDCGTYRVDLAAHRCGPGSSTKPDRDQRRRIAAADPRPDDDRVLVLPTREVDGSYAYHEVDADGLPQCGGGGAVTDDEWRVVSRSEARTRGKSPCNSCLRVAGADRLDDRDRAEPSATTTGTRG